MRSLKKYLNKVLIIVCLLSSCGIEHVKHDSILNYKGAVVVKRKYNRFDGYWYTSLRIDDRKANKYEIIDVHTLDGNLYNIGDTIK